MTVDGVVVREQGMRVDPERARIEVDGERINVAQQHRYLILNKPAGVVTTVRDPQGRPTVVDLVRERTRLYPVGRLDADTLGLVIMTNHGELAHRLMHPRYGVERAYVAEIRGTPPDAAIRRLRDGVPLDDGVARATSARVRGRTGRRTQVEVVMTEGRKHEVRRMFEAIGFPVARLVRTGFGPLRLGDLPSGASRILTPAEVGKLLRLVGL